MLYVDGVYMLVDIVIVDLVSWVTIFRGVMTIVAQMKHDIYCD